MELIRCDNPQCNREIRVPHRHFEIEIRGMMRLGSDDPNTVQVCSEACGAAWFGERQPPVTYESDPVAITSPIQQ